MEACSEKIIDAEGVETAGRLITVQFYLKHDEDTEASSDTLYKLDKIGPDVDEDAVICVRRKLEFNSFYVDKVTIYETDIGVEAMLFAVGDLSETFGRMPEEPYTATDLYFTPETRLVSLSGYSSYTGIKGVVLSSLDRDCAKLATE